MPNQLRDIGFIELQLHFANAVARITGRETADCLLDYTHLYFLLHCAGRFDPSNPTWLQFLSGYRTAKDQLAWTYSFYCVQAQHVPPEPTDNSFGCFSYAIRDSGDVRLHFQNVETVGVRPLSQNRKDVRSAELRALFSDVRSKAKETANVIGGSWLYNIEAYRRLFPPAYLGTAQKVIDEYQFIAQWGQFIDSQGKLRNEWALPFRKAVEQATSLDELDRSFPYQVIRLCAPLKVFYEWYGLE